MAETKKLSIIAFSGDFDKLTAVFTLGTSSPSGDWTPSNLSTDVHLQVVTGLPRYSDS